MIDRFWLAGSLGNHRRGRVLQEAAGPTISVVEPPDGHGLCMMFGTDFQGNDVKIQKEWVNWSQVPGRVLLLIPILKVGACAEPVKWEVTAKAGVDAKDSDELLQALASEVRNELRGKLQTATQLGGAWGDYAVNTAFYRKHPHSGIFAVTCLPLWSLSVLDHKDALRQWLSELYAMAGTPAQLVEEEESRFQPTASHFAIMFYLLGGKFADRDIAIRSLDKSDIFNIDTAEAGHILNELEKENLIEGTKITPSGLELLNHSPFAFFMSDIEKLSLQDKYS